MMSEPERVTKMYAQNDTLSTRIGLHDKYSVNPYGFHNWIFDQFDFRDGMRILELACGTAALWIGRTGRLPENISVALSDLSPLMVEKARAALSDNPHFSFEQIDIQNIPYADSTFDTVIANHMLYHVPDKDRALTEVRRVLKPGGRFYATTTGQNTYGELREIYRKLADKAAFSLAANISFTLENGGELLGKYFEKVEKREYIDALRVTDIDDLMAYIQSYNDVPADVKDDLRTLVTAGFDKDGLFPISKEQGLFICKK